jgi:hypothetical protein
MRVRAPPPAPTNLVLDQRLHATGQPWGHHGATPRRPAQRRSAGNWRSSVPLHSSACPHPVALPQAPAGAGAPGGSPQRARQRPRVTTSPGPFACTGAGQGGPRQAVKDGTGQATGPGGRADRLCHPGSLRHSMGMRRPLLGPPAGAVRLTAKAGLPTPGLSPAIGRYCLSESLRPTVVSRRTPGGPRPMRGQRSLPPHGVCSATCLAARTWSRAHIEELVGTLVRRQRRRFEPITRAGCRSVLTAPSLW